MSDYRETLERARAHFPAPELPVEAILRRRTRKQRNRRIAAGVVGLMVAALVIGGWIGAVLMTRTTPADRDEQPSPRTPTVEASRALPNRPGEWTFDTSLGPWTWTRVDGDAETLPGTVSFFADGRYWAFDRGLWSSADGITWTREAMPDVFGGREPYRVQADDGGAVWATTEDGLYLLEGGSSWRAVDVPPASVPSLPGMVWFSGEVRPLLTQGVRTLALRPIHGGIDWQAVYGEGAYGEIDDGELVVWSGFGGEPGPDDEIARLEMQIVPGGPGAVEFHDVDSGDLVLRIEATDPRVTIEGIAGNVNYNTAAGSPPVTELLVDDGTGFRQVQPPWSGMSIESVDIASGVGGFVAVGVDTPEWYERDVSSEVFVWRSSDGVAWERLESPSLGADLREIGLAGDGERLVLAAIGASPDAARPVVLWSSIDGAPWQPVADLGDTADFTPDFSITVGGEGGAAIVALPVMPSSAEGVAQPMLSADGTTWEAIPQGPDVGDGLCGTGGGYGGGHPVGDAVFVTSGCDKTGHRILWVGRLSGPSAVSG